MIIAYLNDADPLSRTHYYILSDYNGRLLYPLQYQLHFTDTTGILKLNTTRIEITTQAKVALLNQYKISGEYAKISRLKLPVST